MINKLSFSGLNSLHLIKLCLIILCLNLFSYCSSHRNPKSKNQLISDRNIAIQLWSIDPSVSPTKKIKRSDIFKMGKENHKYPSGKKMILCKIINLTASQSNTIFSQYQDLEFKKIKNYQDTLLVEFRTAGIILKDSIAQDTFYISYGYDNLVFNGKSHISMNNSFIIDSIKHYIFETKK